MVKRFQSGLVFFLTHNLRAAVNSKGCAERLKRWKEKQGHLADDNSQYGLMVEIIDSLVEKLAA